MKQLTKNSLENVQNCSIVSLIAQIPAKRIKTEFFFYTISDMSSLALTGLLSNLTTTQQYAEVSQNDCLQQQRVVHVFFK